MANEVCFQLGHPEIAAVWVKQALANMVDRPFDRSRPFVRSHSVQNQEIFTTQAASLFRLINYIFPSDQNLLDIFLDLVCQRLCGDDRDRIYGMLGLVPATTISPDYSLSTRQAYAHFVETLVRADAFRILHACCISLRNVNLPLYVPPFGPNKLYHIPISASAFGATWNTKWEQPFFAGARYSPMISADQLQQIAITEVKVDTIEDFVDFQRGLTTVSSCALKVQVSSPWREIYEVILSRLVPDHKAQLMWRLDLFSVTLTKRLPRYCCTTSRQSSLARVLSTMLHLDDDSPTLSLLDRSLFWTNDGYVGWGQDCLRRGDRVVVLNGDSTLCILREKKPQDCLLYTSPSPRDGLLSRMPSSA